MKKIFSFKELGVDENDEPFLVFASVVKAIDSIYCGDAEVTRVNKKDGAIEAIFLLKSFQ